MIKEFFSTSYIFLIHCTSLKCLVFTMFCSLHGQTTNFKLPLEVYFIWALPWKGIVCFCISTLDEWVSA